MSASFRLRQLLDRKSEIMIVKRVFVALVLLGMGTYSNSVVAMPQQSEAIPVKLKNFLEAAKELRDYSRTGYTSNFTGQLRQIPEELQSQLTKEFPQYRFHIAKMSVLIDAPPDTYDLILITRANTGEVQSFLWGEYWMIPGSASWAQLLAGYQATSKEDAINKIESLAKLIAYAAAANVGEATAKRGKLRVELLKDSKSFGFLEVKTDKHFRFGQLTLTGPDGKKLRHFV